MPKKSTSNSTKGASIPQSLPPKAGSVSPMGYQDSRPQNSDRRVTKGKP